MKHAAGSRKHSAHPHAPNLRTMMNTDRYSMMPTVSASGEMGCGMIVPLVLALVARSKTICAQGNTQYTAKAGLKI